MTPSSWISIAAQALPVIFAAGMVYRELRGMAQDLASYDRRMDSIEARIRSLEAIATRNRERLRSLERAVFKWHVRDDEDNGA